MIIYKYITVLFYSPYLVGRLYFILFYFFIKMGDDWNIYNSSCNWVLLCNFVSFKWVLSFIKLNYLTSLKVMYKQIDGYTTYPLHRWRSLTFPWQTYCKFSVRLGSKGGGGHSCNVNFEVISIYTYPVLSKF